MSLFHYLHDKIIMILFQFLLMLALSFYLLALGNSGLTLLTIILVWTVVIITYLGLDYYKRGKFFRKILDQMEQMEKPYLIYEFIEKTWRYEDQLYKEIIGKSSKGALESIAKLEEEQNEYKSFIEGWIHEVKLPITSLYLMSAELTPVQARKLQLYLTDVENQVNQALYSARSDQVYQDYLIKEVSLEQVVKDLVKKNKTLLIQNQMVVSIECEDNVLTDSKWLSFILNQLLFNAVKYKQDGRGSIQFSSVATKDGTKLMVKDTGIGIEADELPRIFNKGFTGTNGRSRGKSTGFGLYLCRKLCTKLGLGISAYSQKDVYTEIIITFPKNSYLSDL